jgi:hypothetical protein
MIVDEQLEITLTMRSNHIFAMSKTFLGGSSQNILYYCQCTKTKFVVVLVVVKD